MTDAERRDAAVAELKLTTAGWRKANGNPNYPSGTAPATTHWGKAMDWLDQIGQAPPPPTDFDVLNYRINTAGGGTNVTRAIWLQHTSPNMPTDQWGGVPVRSVKWSEAGYEYWGLYQLLIPTSYNSANEGNQYATVLDLHPVGGEVGWYGVGGISNMHIKYGGGNLMLQHYPNTDVGGRQVWDIATGMAKGQRHSILFHTIFGRPGLSVPNHPNGGMGKTRVWFDGSLTVDTGNIKNIYEAKVGLKETSKLNILEGHYSYNQQAVNPYEMTAGLWGTTREEALTDSAVTFRGVAPTGGDSYTALPPLSSSSFVLPVNA